MSYSYYNYNPFSSSQRPSFQSVIDGYLGNLAESGFIQAGSLITDEKGFPRLITKCEKLSTGEWLIVDIQGTLPPSMRVTLDQGLMPCTATVASSAPSQEVVEEKKEPAKPFTVEILDSVILPEGHKELIVSTLNQHATHDLIFKTWGLAQTIEYGKAMSFLFHGLPGTGKTQVAHAIAKALKTELLSIDTAKLASSVPGEMERNLTAAFDEAKEKKRVLFLDECDSLVMSRVNVGMILGAQINHLLRCIEQYDGVVVLTTNRVGELDEALERRISCILRFPRPTLEMRIKIWQKLLPTQMPLAKDVSLDELGKYELTGGLIKNAILGAARLAASEGADCVALKHFASSIESVLRGAKAFKTPSRVPTPYLGKQNGSKV